MPLIMLNDRDFEKTTLLDVIRSAEDDQSDRFEMVHLSLDSGRELILLAVTADNLQPMADVLEGIRVMREEG